MNNNPKVLHLFPRCALPAGVVALLVLLSCGQAISQSLEHDPMLDLSNDEYVLGQDDKEDDAHAGDGESYAPESFDVLGSWSWSNPWPQGGMLTSVAITPDMQPCIVGEWGVFLKSSDGGALWQVAQPIGYSASRLSDIEIVDASCFYVVGAYGKMFKSTDGGSSWAALTLGQSAGITGVSFVDRDIGWVVGLNGTVMSTANGGT